jgi:hypothetical protein
MGCRALLHPASPCFTVLAETPILSTPLPGLQFAYSSASFEAKFLIFFSHHPMPSQTRVVQQHLHLWVVEVVVAWEGVRRASFAAVEQCLLGALGEALEHRVAAAVTLDRAINIFYIR